MLKDLFENRDGIGIGEVKERLQKISDNTLRLLRNEEIFSKGISDYESWKRIWKT